MHEDLARPIQTSQLIVGALIMGMVTFGAMVVGLVMMQGPLGRDPQLERMMVAAAVVTWVGCTVAAAALWMIMLVRTRRVWEAGGLRQGGLPGQPTNEDVAGFLPPYTSALILRAAMLEGPGLFGIIVFLLTGNWIGMVIAGLSALGLAAMFPTRSKFLAYASRIVGRPVL